MNPLNRVRINRDWILVARNSHQEEAIVSIQTTSPLMSCRPRALIVYA
jgi:hypothetical protein